MHTLTCPTCHAAKVRLAPRKGLTDAVWSGLMIYPFRCQLCAERFRKFLGHRTLNPRRNFERIQVSFPVWFKPIRSTRYDKLGQEGVMENLSIRGCRIRCAVPARIGSQLELEFRYSDDSLPVMVEEAIVHSIAEGGIGLRFTRLRRGDERRIRQIVDVWLSESLSSA